MAVPLFLLEHRPLSMHCRSTNGSCCQGFPSRIIRAAYIHELVCRPDLHLHDLCYRRRWRRRASSRPAISIHGAGLASLRRHGAASQVMRADRMQPAATEWAHDPLSGHCIDGDRRRASALWILRWRPAPRAARIAGGLSCSRWTAPSCSCRSRTAVCPHAYFWLGIFVLVKIKIT